MQRSRVRPQPHDTPLVSLVAAAAANSHAAALAANEVRAADMRRAAMALAKLARASILERGLVASESVRADVDAVAARHLKRAAADRQLTRALQKVGDREVREAIEVAHAQVLDLSELTHYYAGVFWCLALMDIHDRG